MQILVGYFNEHTTDEQIAARAEGFISPMALQGVPPVELARRRSAMKAQLADRPALFDACYKKFFFVDKYPENAVHPVV